MDPKYNDVVEILPDSRLKTSRVAVSGHHPYAGGNINWVQIFCANCGAPYGYVPEQNCTFACWLCTPCSQKWGDAYAGSLMPDEAMWAKTNQVMVEECGRVLTDAEVKEAAQFSCNPLSILLREIGV